MRKVTLALLLLLLVSSLPAFSQGDSNSLKKVVLQLQSFYSGHPVEKAYLHFDRPGYVAGDTIYFKAYVTFGEQHELSRQSGVLYVDLINPRNKIYRSIKLQLKNGLAWGDFALPDTLSKGYYNVKAYTLLMKSTHETDYFEQMIPIGSAAKADATPNPVANKPDLQFFPEGGNMVYGVNSKIAFKAIGANGMGLNVSGAIVDNTGQMAAKIVSAHLGMGVFNLTPDPGKTYKAIVAFADGTQNTFDLPLPATSGIFLAVNNNDPDNLTIGIRCNEVFFDQNKNKDFSLVMNSGTSVSSVAIKLKGPLIDADLPKNKFRTGVVQLTLFSPAGDPLSERLVFMQRPDLLKLNINAGKTAYRTREKVSVSLNTKSGADSATRGHFSVSVIDENKVPANEKNMSSILSWLLLSSDLKGYIEEPDYYFADTGSETQANLDILMLTQGYRRFVWKRLLNDEYPQQADQPEKALGIKGLVMTPQGKPVVKGKVDLINVEGGRMLTMLTDTSGKFNFTNLAFADSTRFIIKAVNAKNRSRNRIEYFRDTPEATFSGSHYPLHADIDSLMANALQNHRMQQDELAKYGLLKGKLLHEIKIKDKKESPLEAVRVLGTADQLLRRDDIKGYGKLSDCLNGLLLGVVFLKPAAGFTSLPYLTTPITLGMKGDAVTGNPPMIIMVDGIRISPEEGLDNVYLEDVEKVEVFRNATAGIMGAEGAAGVLYVTTVKGSSTAANRSVSSGILPITAHGYFMAREFYSPRYEHNQPNNQADLRSTIYWNPELPTDKNGNASFDYYNADGTGTYRMVIEGIDDKGNLGRQIFSYKVE